MTGASGLVGTALTAVLSSGGHRVLRLARSRQEGRDSGVTLWDPDAGIVEPSKLEGLDAVVHLAGESIAGGRWTPGKKRRIRDSRVVGTATLVRSLGELSRPPRVFVCASAIGYYGHRHDEILTEKSHGGMGFLAGVCEQWEQAGAAAAAWADRVVSTRFGVVLSPRGGALAKMLPAFRMGGGGRIGKGQQYMSWISVDDAAAALIYILTNAELKGPVNFVSPEPVRNLDFTRALARVVRRPAVIPMPAPLARVLFGEMADELLLGSSRVIPEKLLASEFEFGHVDLSSTLSFYLG